MTPGPNSLKLQVYNGFSTTPVSDLSADLEHAAGLFFETFFPGGLFGSCGFDVARDPLRMWLFRQGHRLVIRNGAQVVYEGGILAPGYGATGRMVEATGYWGKSLLGSRGLNKPWCDTRVSEDAWPETTTGSDYCTVDRLERIQLTPKNLAWSSGLAHRVRYTAPVGQTVKRLTYNYQFDEGAGDWKMSVWRSTDNVSYTEMDTNGVSGDTYASGTTTIISAAATGSIDVTLATPGRYVELRLTSNAIQTPAADGSIAARWTSLKVFTETGSINPTEIVKDVIGAISSLNTDTSQVDSNTLTMEPFTTEGYEMAASVLARLARFGDSSFLGWGAYLIESDASTTARSGKPVLCFKQGPLWGDYEYAIRFNEPNLAGDVRVNEGQIWNYIIVNYTDLLGRQQVVTPDDDANLKDSTSITANGQFEYVLRAGQVTQAMAISMGRRFLANHKDRGYYVSGPVRVVGTIRSKHGLAVPVSHVRARQRVRLENFTATETAGNSGVGFTQHITHTRYDDASQTVDISFGVPDLFEVLVAQLALSANAGAGSLPGF
jgi:hypothetical protein